MAGNTNPIYSRVGQIEWGVIDTANTAKDGTGTVVTVFTADATNGGRVEKLKVRAKGTNVATVLRVWLNNGGSNATPANNTLYTEQTIAATTVSEVAALADTEIALNLALPPAYKINITIGTTVAAGLHVSAVGGAY
jgi:hypothetical protein